ncbi:MAG TPA: WD40 repeat domain-containing protein [Thermoanaerobaculia bacterium]|nr:WD40 repeat domain-containing protein [Thermoanaerobaculia bacterium]
MPLRRLNEFVRLGAHVLTARPQEFLAQLLGRLDEEDPSLRLLREQAVAIEDHPWLCPRRASLATAGGALLRTFLRHETPVRVVSVLPDALTVVSGDASGWLRVWNLETGEEQGAWPAHASPVDALAVGPDGAAVTASASGGLRLWNLSMRSLDWEASGDVFTALTWTQDRQRLVAGTREGALRIWRGQVEEACLKGDGQPIRALAIAPDGRVALTAAGGTVRLWDLADGVGRVLVERREPIVSLAVSYDGRLLAGVELTGELAWDHEGSVGGDPSVGIYDLETGRELARLKGHGVRRHEQQFFQVVAWWERAATKALLVTADGRRALSAGEDGEVRVWDLEELTLLQTLPAHGAPVAALAVTPDGRRALSASDDGTVRVWDLKVRSSIPAIRHSQRVGAVAITRDGSYGLSASAERDLWIWDAGSGELLAKLDCTVHRSDSHPTAFGLIQIETRAEREGVSTLALDPIGLSYCRMSWNMLERRRTNDDPWSADDFDGDTRPVRGEVAVSQDESRAIASTWSNLFVWDLGVIASPLTTVPTTLELSRRLRAARDAEELMKWIIHLPRYSVYRRVRRNAAVTTSEGAWTRLLRKVRTSGRHEVSRRSVLVDDESYEGPLILAFNEDFRVRTVLAARSQYRLKPLGDAAPRLLAITERGERAVSCHGDNQILVWDCDSGGLVREVRVPGSQVTVLALTATGDLAATGSRDGLVALWDLDSGQRVATFTGESEITAIAISSGGGAILAGEASGQVHLLERRPQGAREGRVWTAGRPLSES